MNSRDPTDTRRAQGQGAAAVAAELIITAGLWVLMTLAIFPLSQGTLPFQLKLFDDKGTPFLGRIFIFEGSLFLALVIMGLAYLVTIRRPVPDMAARAPAVAVARAETLGMVGYAIVAQIAGCFPGPCGQRLRH